MSTTNPAAIKRLYADETGRPVMQDNEPVITTPSSRGFGYTKDDEPADISEHEEYEESLSLEDTERELIQKALRRHNNRRKNAAKELGISERTLYRKIKEYNLK